MHKTFPYKFILVWDVAADLWVMAWSRCPTPRAQAAHKECVFPWTSSGVSLFTWHYNIWATKASHFLRDPSVTIHTILKPKVCILFYFSREFSIWVPWGLKMFPRWLFTLTPTSIYCLPNYFELRSLSCVFWGFSFDV